MLYEVITQFEHGRHEQLGDVAASELAEITGFCGIHAMSFILKLGFLFSPPAAKGPQAPWNPGFCADSERRDRLGHDGGYGFNNKRVSSVITSYSIHYTKLYDNVYLCGREALPSVVLQISL